METKHTSFKTRWEGHSPQALVDMTTKSQSLNAANLQPLSRTQCQIVSLPSSTYCKIARCFAAFPCEIIAKACQDNLSAGMRSKLQTNQWIPMKTKVETLRKVTVTVHWKICRSPVPRPRLPPGRQLFVLHIPWQSLCSENYRTLGCGFTPEVRTRAMDKQLLRHLASAAVGGEKHCKRKRTKRIRSLQHAWPQRHRIQKFSERTMTWSTVNPSLSLSLSRFLFLSVSPSFHSFSLSFPSLSPSFSLSLSHTHSQVVSNTYVKIKEHTKKSTHIKLKDRQTKQERQRRW